MTKLDKILLVMVLIAAVASLYAVAINDETLTEQRSALDSLQQQIKTVSEQVQEQEKYLSTVTDFIPGDRIVVHGEGMK